MQFHGSWRPPSPSSKNSFIFSKALPPHQPPQVGCTPTTLPELHATSPRSICSFVPLSPVAGLEEGWESHISPRNSGKSTPAFNEKAFFFPPLLSSIAKLIKMESTKKFQQKGGVGEEQREDPTHLNLS